MSAPQRLVEYGRVVLLAVCPFAEHERLAIVVLETYGRQSFMQLIGQRKGGAQGQGKRNVEIGARDPQ
jgi:hypothetical protein